jgi:hypothetical protein
MPTYTQGGKTTILNGFVKGDLSVEGTATFKKKVVTVSATANTTLTADQSGAVIFLPQATVSNTITLPAVASGLNFRFVVTADPDASHTQTISSATASKLYGILEVTKQTTDSGGSQTTNSVVTCTSFTAQSNLILSGTVAASSVGDYADFECDGTKWYIRAHSTADATSTAAGWSTS